MSDFPLTSYINKRNNAPREPDPLAAARCTVDGCKMRITTPEAQWAYAVAIPRSAEAQSVDFVKSTCISHDRIGGPRLWDSKQ
jgi:hypothetical protein